MNHSTIADVLFTKTQQRVLGLLYGKPERSFYLNEIVRLTSMGKGAVSRELSKLVQAGLLNREAKGSEHASSDIDVLLVGDDLSYAEVMALLAEAEKKLARTINPTLLTPQELTERLASKQSFITRVMEQPKLWLKQP